MEDHDVFIPIQAQMQYLGAVLSYHSFESQTAELRAQQANINFAQLRKVLRTSGGLSLARRLSIYKMCVWSALLYGIVSVGVNANACKTLQSTAAMHLRKLLRIHTKGHTNAAILAQADLPLLPHLQQRADQQARTLTKDLHRSSTLRWQEEERNQQIRQQLDLLRERDLSPTLVQIPATEAQPLDCSICGQTFVTAAGLHQHIHRQHPEVEQAASMDFRRDKHSMFGLPQCRFCHTRMSSWQTLTKHITQGFCLRVKLAIGQGHTIDQLMSTIEEEERSNPPSRPLGDSEQIDSVVIPADIRRIVQDIPVRDLPTHRQVLRANDRQCWLCGQRMVQASRIKSHWQSTHPETWRLCHRHAQTEASSLSSIFRRPCDFCGSTARNTKLHSGQCPVMFQILALKWLDSQGKLDSIDPGHKIKAVKQKVQPPAYKSFISPLAQAFGKSGGTPNTSSSTTTMVAGTLTGMNSDSSHSVGKPPIRKIRDMLQPRTGNITDYFRRSSATATPTLPPQHVTISCQVRLRNPHNHCYANASILALLHGLSTATMEIDRLRFLTKVCLLAVAKNKEVLLSQMYLFRMLTPR